MQRRFTNKLECHYVLVCVAIFVYLSVQYVLLPIAHIEENPDYKTWSKPSILKRWIKEFSWNLVFYLDQLSMLEDEDKFKCSHCTCSFKKLGSLNAHISRFHPDDLEVAIDGDPHTDPLAPFLSLEAQG